MMISSENAQKARHDYLKKEVGFEMSYQGSVQDYKNLKMILGKDALEPDLGETPFSPEQRMPASGAAPAFGTSNQTKNLE